MIARPIKSGPRITSGLPTVGSECAGCKGILTRNSEDDGYPRRSESWKLLTRSFQTSQSKNSKETNDPFSVFIM